MIATGLAAGKRWARDVQAQGPVGGQLRHSYCAPPIALTAPERRRGVAIGGDVAPQPPIAAVRPPPNWLQTLAGRYDRVVFEPQPGQARVRLAVLGADAWDAVLDRGEALIGPAEGDADAILAADEQTWATLAEDLRGGMDAYRSGELSVRRNLHLGVGFLAATSGLSGPGRLRFRIVGTRRARLSTIEAGSGPPIVALHGLGATKGSFLPTVAALSSCYRVIAADLPGFGDSDKPIGASYDPRFFARAVIDLLDALELDRAHLIGNSLGGRVALEVGLLHPDRVDRLVLLAPSLAWRRGRAGRRCCDSRGLSSDSFNSRPGRLSRRSCTV